MPETIRDDIADALRDLMGEISEQCWCAGWLGGCEHPLYRIAFKGADREWGMNEVHERQAEKLKRLAVASDSWWHWPDDVQDGPVRISLAEAERLYGNA